MSSAPIISVTDPQDERLRAYMQLKDKSLKQEGLLIAEGQILVDRVIHAGLEVESILVLPRLAEAYAQREQVQCPIYVMEESVMHGLLGYAFHRGVMLCMKRPALLDMPSLLELLDTQDRTTLVVLPEVNDVENLGAIIRSAAALGVDGLLLGERCSDPFYRRVIRVSMGAVFDLPIAISENLQQDLAMLKTNGYKIAGTVLAENSIDLKDYQRPEKLALLFGPEGEGLWQGHVKQCDDLLSIPMANAVDSLNLAMAATVFMYQLR